MEPSRAAIPRPARQVLAGIRHVLGSVMNLLSLSVGPGLGSRPFGGSRPHFLPHCDAKVTIPPQEHVTFHQTQMGDENMRVLIICALVITATVGVSGCFHHQKAVTQEPLKLG